MTFVFVVLFVVSVSITGSIISDNGGTGNEFVDFAAFIITVVSIYIMGKNSD